MARAEQQNLSLWEPASLSFPEYSSKCSNQSLKYQRPAELSSQDSQANLWQIVIIETTVFLSRWHLETPFLFSLRGNPIQAREAPEP